LIWLDIKNAIEAATGLDKDALHIHGAILAQLGFAFLFRRSLASFIPWLLVLVLALANEAHDLWIEIWPEVDRDRQWGEGMRDLWNSMFAPSLLLVAARLRPRLFVSPADPSGARDETRQKG